MEQNNEVILGVDTHLDAHVGAVISETGKLLGTLSVSTDTTGYLNLVSWANSFGHLRRAGDRRDRHLRRGFGPRATRSRD
jgi:hypothetical protein